jgi:hypothetical protein
MKTAVAGNIDGRTCSMYLANSLFPTRWMPQMSALIGSGAGRQIREQNDPIRRDLLKLTLSGFEHGELT